MYKSTLLILLLLSTIGYANNIITVDSQGTALMTYENLNTIREIAIQDALRKAVTKVNGLELNSTSYTNNFELKYDKIFVQNGGIIKDYNILNEFKSGNYYYVKLSADIISNKSKKRHKFISSKKIKIYISSNDKFLSGVNNELAKTYTVTEDKTDANIIVRIDTKYNYENELIDGVIAGNLYLTIKIVNLNGVILSEKFFQETAIGSTQYFVKSKVIKKILPAILLSINKLFKNITPDQIYCQKQQDILEIWLIGKIRSGCQFMMNTMGIQKYSIKEIKAQSGKRQLIKINVKQQIRANDIIEKAMMLGHFKVLDYSKNILKLEEIM